MRRLKTLVTPQAPFVIQSNALAKIPAALMPSISTAATSNASLLRVGAQPAIVSPPAVKQVPLPHVPRALPNSRSTVGARKVAGERQALGPAMNAVIPATTTTLSAASSQSSVRAEGKNPTKVRPSTTTSGISKDAILKHLQGGDSTKVHENRNSIFRPVNLNNNATPPLPEDKQPMIFFKGKAIIYTKSLELTKMKDGRAQPPEPGMVIDGNIASFYENGGPGALVISNSGSHLEQVAGLMAYTNILLSPSEELFDTTLSLIKETISPNHFDILKNIRKSKRLRDEWTEKQSLLEQTLFKCNQRIRQLEREKRTATSNLRPVAQISVIEEELGLEANRRLSLLMALSEHANEWK